MIEPGSSAQSADRHPAFPWPPPSGAQTTGRFVVVFAEAEEPESVLRSVAGVSNVASSRDFDGRAVDANGAAGADATVFSNLGIAVVSADPSQLNGIQRSIHAQRSILSVSPELVHHVRSETTGAYLSGYRDGIADLSGRLGLSGYGPGAPEADAPAAAFEDTAQHTWGLQATQVPSSPYSGRGIKLAVLDTGFDAAHPDFADRNMTAASFIEGESPQDGHGHGTHCVGTAAGPRTPLTGPRYGVASEAEIFAGKVLSDSGSGSDSGVLAGIDWAVTNGCAVISMSLGADVPQVHPPYTAAGSRALDQGSLIIAAAGNNANRPEGNFGFVGSPANSPHIMAVAALDQQLDIAYFSARSLPGRGGQVDVAGPGFQVYSSWMLPEQYRTISGTSMATPHAAGIAALWAEATGYRGRELWATLVQENQRLAVPSLDAGSGLVLAPQ